LERTKEFGEDKRSLGMKKGVENEEKINQNKDERKLEQRPKDVRVEFTMKGVGTTPYFFQSHFSN
jgi:hypothetical protein